MSNTNHVYARFIRHHFLSNDLGGLMTTKRFALSALLACGLSGAASAATVFSEDFDSRTSGNVTAASDLGSDWVFTGSTYGAISSGTDKAYTTGSSGAQNGAGQNVFAEGAPFPNTFTVDPATAANKLSVDFDAVQVNSPNAATVAFETGSFGTQNAGSFKALVVRGLSEAGDEVFETFIAFGSGNGTRRIHHRAIGDTTYTRTGSSAGSPAGTQVYTNLPGTWNSTNATAKPSNLHGLTLTLENGQITYSVDAGTAGGTLSFALSNTDNLASLEFTSFQNGATGNAGYWLDNISVNGTLVPEPGSLALLGLGGLAMIRRRR